MNKFKLGKMDTEIVKKLNDSVSIGIEASRLNGFEKAFKLAEATGELQRLLDKNYMEPIMKLQGNKLGFKTDKDNGSGYPVEVVKNCIIEAVLTGVQVVNNQFNIIAGNCYITKEGYGYLLKQIPGLDYDIIPKLPRVSQDKSSAAIVMVINWTLPGVKESREIEFGVVMNQYMKVDAIVGKATRKARKWLYEKITGVETSDGDVEDVKHEVVTDDTPKIDTSNATAKNLFETENKK